MALTITHEKALDVPDGTNDGLVLPSDWNAAHVLSGVASIAQGGTGLSSYTLGDLVYASGAAALSKLAAVAVGMVLVSAGVGAAPAYSATPTLSRVLTTGAGSASNPTITIGESNTGGYLPSTGILKFTVAGTAVARIGSGGADTNLAWGAGALQGGSFTGSRVTVYGHAAAPSMTSAYQSVVIGYGAANAMTDGYMNVIIGDSAASAATSLYWSVIIGKSAGSSLVGAVYGNVFVGPFAGTTSTSATNCTFIGDSAGRLNQTGISLTAVGRAALDANVSGNYNAAFAHQSLFRNTTGHFNSAYGDASALWATTASYGSYFGNYAGATTVDANANVSGDYVSCFGYNTGPSSAVQCSRSTAIGQSAQYSGSNMLILGGAGATNYVLVGIGLTTPVYKLDVVGQTFRLGADSASDVLTTDATNKLARFFARHYTNAEEPVFVIGCTASSGGNTIQIGGGTAETNAATAVTIYTAANGTTLTGTAQWSFASGAFLPLTATNDIGSTAASNQVRHIYTLGYVEGTEMTAPSAPAANGYRLFAEDNGSGKTRLMAIFASGAAQQLAIQP